MEITDTVENSGKRKLILDNEDKTRKRSRTDFFEMDTQGSTASTITTYQTSQAHVPSKVQHIFQHLYEDVVSLYTWVSRINIEELDLIQEGDPQGYLQLLHTTLVAEVETQTVLPPTSLSQASHQREVLLRVIQRLKRKNTSNVLTFGFEYSSDNPNAHVLPHMPGLEYREPNSAFNRLQFSPWKKLLSRIGDELMTRLLERTSVFYSVPPSNYVQLTGVPIFDMWPYRGAMPFASKKDDKEIRTKPNCKPICPDSSIQDINIGRHQSSLCNQTHVTEKRIKRKQESCERKKRKRRKKILKKHVEEEANFKPFDFHKLLPRQSILYSKCLAEQLPKTFCLRVVDSPLELSKLILGMALCVNLPDQDQEQQQDEDKQVPPEEGRILPEVSHSQTLLEALCRKLIHSHRKCRYKSLLSRYCEHKHNSWFRNPPPKSVPVYTRGKNEADHIQRLTRRKKRPWSIGQLLDSTVSARQIFLFLRAVCLRVIPVEMFGDIHNRKIFFKHLKEILSLGLHEKYCLGQVMMNVKVTSYKCLDSETGHLHRVRIVAQIHWWILTSYILPVIKAFFYVTETNLYRNRLLFYRKTVWLQLHTRALAAHLQRKMLTPIPQEQVEALLNSDEALGVSHLRFLPKLKSLRPVINMGRKPEPWTKKKLSINSQLKTVLSILQYHIHQNPTLVQSGKFGFDDILVAYRKFIMNRHASNDDRPLYFVKTDINKCYDNILQDKLYSAIKDIVMSEDEYITRRSASVLVVGDRLKRIFHRQTFTLTDYEPDFRRFVKQQSNLEGLKNRVFVDQVLHSNTTAEEALKVIRCHLFNNIIKIGKRFYRQTVGIGQGSVLSTMLCTLYTAHMEQLTMTSPDGDELLMRLVDDNLYITPYRDKAVSFLNTALRGNKDYNLYSNMEKVLVNFQYHHPELGPVLSIEDTAPFPWCGMLFDPQSLSVSVDYSRYEGQAVRDTLTLDFSAHPGLCLKNKLLLTLRSRCHSLYLDPKINKITARIENIFKAFLLSADKLHCYVLNVWPARRRNNYVYLKNVILTLAQFLYNKQESVLKEIHVEPEANILPLSFPLIKWLCVQAHVVRLQKHHSMYTSLLTLLKRYRKGFWRKMSAQDRQEAQIVKRTDTNMTIMMIN